MEPTTAPTLGDILNAALTNPNPLLASWELFSYLFLHGGWIIVVVAVLYGLYTSWIFYIRKKYDQTRQWVLLAIDVPKDNEQSPKAVENIFSHLAGAHGSKTLWEKYWVGATQDWFSLEMISVEGYVQFIIRTIVRYRDLVEVAVYAQYPDAVITEIEDYTIGFPTAFPNERYDMYGTEFVLVENQAFPIRTYPEFEHPLTQEFKDPLSAVLETMGKLGSKEQLWLQIIIVPTDDSWKERAIGAIKRLIGEKQKKKARIFGSVWDEIGKLGQTATGQVTGTGSSTVGAAKASKEELPSRMLYLSPYDKERVEAISRKLKKIGFQTKIRSVYIAHKEVFNVQRGREALIGAVKQFNTADLNSFKPDTKHIGVHASYFFTEWRKNWKRTRLMRWYKRRSPDYGRSLYILNIEELATIWHFPTKTITAPLRYMVQKTEFKRIAPPAAVPFGEQSLRGESSSAALAKAAPPGNLPYA